MYEKLWFTVESGDVFGWGNNEYDQLCAVTQKESQVSVPQRLPFKGVGKVIQVAAAGSTCALLNGKWWISTGAIALAVFWWD